MNNAQFRRLVLDKPSSPPSSSDQGTKGANGGEESSRGSGTPLLGSRMKSNIPMTPRSVGGVDFVRQLAEHRRESSGQPPTKKFKSSAAPKGAKYAPGYQDRSLTRRQQETEEGEGSAGADVDDRGRRVQALEEMVKLGQIDMATFEKLRADIGVGGNIGSTHLVKGLDWKLLQRVKAGEDITKEPDPEPRAAEEGNDEVNVDEEFERVLDEKEDAVRPVEREEKAKKSSMAPPPPPGQKKTRDQILQALKASRLAAAQQKEEPPASTLGTRFKKIGDKKGEKKRWIEKDEDGRRREVLLTTDAEGKTKRKIRWIDKPGEHNGKEQGAQLLMPNKEAKPLGMEVPTDISLKTSDAAVEEEDDNIFEGVGDEYNPLADIGEDGSSSSSESEGEVKDKSTRPSEERRREDKEEEKLQDTKDSLEVTSSQPKKPRNYFASTSTEPTTEDPSKNPFSTDPTILAALKRAANIRQTSPSATVPGEDGDSHEETDADALQRQKKFLEEARKREMQDAMDMDIGFGGSRFGDEEDEEGVLWADEKGGSNKRKRGPKKRKGDKDSAGDVMKVLEGRKKDGEKDKGKQDVLR